MTDAEKLTKREKLALWVMILMVRLLVGKKLVTEEMDETWKRINHELYVSS